MKFVSVLALCAVSPVALGGVYLAGGSSAGMYAGKHHKAAPAPAPTPAPAPAPSAPASAYTAPTPAPAYKESTPTPNYVTPTPAPAYKAPTPEATPYTASKPAPASYTEATPAPHNGADTGYGSKTGYEMPEEPKCWIETKKCCFEEKADGYECKDDYTSKQARCYPKIKYERMCDKTEADDKPDKPEEYVKYEEGETVKYDENYGTHTPGYPTGGMSETYDTKELPEKPYGVDADPVPYVAPTPQPATYEAPEAPVTSGGGYSADGNGYEAETKPASGGY